MESGSKGSESDTRRKRTENNINITDDSFSPIPNELLTQIFGHLPKQAAVLNRVRKVNKRFKYCIEEDEDLWKSTYEAYFPSVSIGTHASWFDRFLYKSHLQNFWDHSKYQQHTLDGHFGCVCCVRFDKKRIISSSEDKSIKIWDYKSGKCIRSYTGHTEAVWSVRADQDILASAGGDKQIRLWDLSKHKQIRTLEGHRAEVWCVDLNISMNRVVSGSVDSTVGIYDLETGTRLHLLTHHTSSVFGVQLYEQCLLTGSKDGTAHIFDIRQPEKSVYQFGNYMSPIFCLQMDSEKLVTGHGDGSVNVTDVSTAKNMHHIKCHTDSIWSLHFDEDHLATGSADKTIRVQKWTKKGPVDMYGMRNIGSIFSVQLSEDKVMVGDSSGCIQVLDFNNEFPKNWGTGSVARLKDNKAPLPASDGVKFDENGKLNYSVF